MKILAYRRVVKIEFLCIYFQIPMMLTPHKYIVIIETRR